MKIIKQPPDTIWGYIKDISLFLGMFFVNITMYFITGIAIISYITLIHFIFFPHFFPWWFYVYSLAACSIFFIDHKMSQKAFLISCFVIAVLNYIIILYFYPKIFMLG